MSESMAFIGGAALAGIAALVLLKGAVNPGIPNLAASTAVPPLPAQPSMNTIPGQVPTASPDMTAYFTRQQMETDRLKEQLEQYRTETEQLKVQMQNQQFTIDTLNSQLKSNVINGSQTAPGQAIAQQSVNPMLTGILWAAGGMVLTVGGSIIVAGAFALASQQQRPSRTVQVIHPVEPQPAPLPTLRRTEFLPPRLEGRRVDHLDYDR